jgi:hypothetical protein
MNGTSDITAPPPPAGVPLSRWLLILATGLLVAWCVPRVKPVLWFGGLFGLLTGAIAVGLERWFGQPAGRGVTVIAAVCAIIGCAAVFAISIRTAERTNKPSPQDAAAEAMLRSMEQATHWPADDQSRPEAVQPSRITAAERYLAVRYRKYAEPPWLWLAAEVLSAGLVAGAVHGVMNRRRRPAPEAVP